MQRYWSADDVMTIRDFERFLREVGFSRAEAETLGRGGWDALVEYRRRGGQIESSRAGLRRSLGLEAMDDEARLKPVMKVGT